MIQRSLKGNKSFINNGATLFVIFDLLTESSTHHTHCRDLLDILFRRWRRDFCLQAVSLTRVVCFERKTPKMKSIILKTILVHHKPQQTFYPLKLKAKTKYFSDADWQKPRKHLNLAFNLSVLKGFVPIFSRYAKLSADEMAKQHVGGDDFDLILYIGQLTLRTISGIFFAFRFWIPSRLQSQRRSHCDAWAPATRENDSAEVF